MTTRTAIDHIDPSDAEMVALHDAYVVSVNYAVDGGDLVLADELARAFDDDARDLLARRAVLAA